eukprot:scaffold44962_cov18-Tisochrysis_lutea.AAC.1
MEGRGDCTLAHSLMREVERRKTCGIIADVTIRGLRAKGPHNRALYNLFGPGAWAVIDCTAMFPDSEGFVQPRSLLQHASRSLSSPEHQSQGGVDTAAAHGHVGGSRSEGEVKQEEGSSKGSTWGGSSKQMSADQGQEPHVGVGG